MLTVVIKAHNEAEAHWNRYFMDKLSAAGAPSEFAIRAPILGGIATVG